MHGESIGPMDYMVYSFYLVYIWFGIYFIWYIFGLPIWYIFGLVYILFGIYLVCLGQSGVRNMELFHIHPTA